MEGVENPNQGKEISQEVIEEMERIAMEKVSDIDAKGTTYTWVCDFDTKKIGRELWEERQKNVADLLMMEHQKGKISAEELERKLEQSRIEYEEKLENVVAQEWTELKERVRTIITNGIIGVSPEEGRQKNSEGGLIKAKYIRRIKDHKTSDNLVYANIIGRSETYSDVYGKSENVSSTEIGNSYYMRYGDFSVAIIFDKDFFEEVEPKDRKSGRTILVDKWTFNADDKGVLGSFRKAKQVKPDIKIGDEMLRNYGENYSPHMGGKAFDDKGLPKPWEEQGFVFFPRIPKRTFRGLVVKMPKDEIFEQRIQELASIMIEIQKNNPDLVIPVYDTDGNLLWPQRMNSEELAEYLKQKSQQQVQPE